MIIEMTQDAAGVWIYHDDEQAEICLTVMALTGWEITGFDAWINDDTHWSNAEHQGKKNRDELIELRHGLTKTFHDYHHDNYVITLAAERLYAAAQWVAAHIAGYKIARKDKDRADHARKVSKLPRPAAKSAIKEAVLSAMKPHKRDDQEFKSFIPMWEQGPINGLSISAIDDKSYIVTDENGDLGAKKYTWGTLEKMYSQLI